MRSITLPAVCLAGLLASTLAWADPTDLSLVQANPQADGGTAYSVSLQLLLVMTALTLLPSLLLAATSFTRVIIVLSILRQALGTAQTPPNQVLIGIALIVTALVMRPTFDEINATALTPFRGGQIGGEAHEDTPLHDLHEVGLQHVNGPGKRQEDEQNDRQYRQGLAHAARARRSLR